MSRKPNNSGKKWTNSELSKLRQLAPTTETPNIANKLERSESAIRSKASQKHISLKPKDK